MHNRCTQTSYLFPYTTLFRSDLVVVNGKVKRAAEASSQNSKDFWADYAEPNQVFLNDGKGKFSIVPDNAGGTFLQQRERSEEHTSELQSPCNLVCRLLLENKK